jgi:LacI family transcriptional regulator
VNNQTVFGVMRALRDLGMDCPEDISVAGFDDFPWADSFRPQLTTVAQPVREFGEQSARLLLERMAGDGTAPPQHVVLHSRLMVRGSCRALTN